MQYSQLGETSEERQQQQQQKKDAPSVVSSIATNARSSLRSINLGGNSVAATSLKEPLKDDDPFYVFREDLYRKLDLVEDALQQFSSDATTKKKKQVKRAIRNAESTLKDVKMTISLVESQRDRFSHIDSSELYERQALVTTSQDRLDRAKQQLDSSSSQQSQTSSLRNKFSNSNNNTPTTKKINKNNDGYVGGDIEMSNHTANTNLDDDDDPSALTQTLMAQQDETLDELGVAVTRVGEMAMNINEEIGYQGKLLSDLEDDLDDAEQQLGLVMGKLGKFLKTKNKWQLRMIMILILIVFILIFLILM